MVVQEPLGYRMKKKDDKHVLLMTNICNVKKMLLFKPNIGIKDTCMAEG